MGAFSLQDKINNCNKDRREKEVSKIPWIMFNNRLSKSLGQTRLSTKYPSQLFKKALIPTKDQLRIVIMEVSMMK